MHCVFEFERLLSFHVTMQRNMGNHAFEGTMEIVVSQGHLGVLPFFHEPQICTTTTDAMDNAAENGELDTVRFLHENRMLMCTPDAMEYAAVNGDRKMVESRITTVTKGAQVEPSISLQ